MRRESEKMREAGKITGSVQDPLQVSDPEFRVRSQCDFVFLGSHTQLHRYADRHRGR